ncbi:MAG TPA: hypothetical protein VGS15_03620 [Candidatus Acidoferrales bacterium]|nr:hypothetical protein [Candidatus Acidoferrales bacterium]
MTLLAPLRSWLRATPRHENFLLRAPGGPRLVRGTSARKFPSLLVTRHLPLFTGVKE